jgi:hypothetical protein
MRREAAHVRTDHSGLGIAVLLGLVLVTGCGDPGPTSVPTAKVATYGRNQTDSDVEFIVLPAEDPPQGFEVLADRPETPGGLGAGCARIPVGSSLWLTDGQAKPDGSNAVREILRIEAADAGRLKSIWIDALGPGQIVTGGGVPPWWTEDLQTC